MNTKKTGSPRWVLLLGLAAIALAAFSQTPGAKRPASREDLSAYKGFIDKTVSPERVAQFLRYLTAEPHMASSPRDDELARYVQDKWKEFGLETGAPATYGV